MLKIVLPSATQSLSLPLFPFNSPLPHTTVMKILVEKKEF